MNRRQQALVLGSAGDELHIVPESEPLQDEGSSKFRGLPRCMDKASGTEQLEEARKHAGSQVGTAKDWIAALAFECGWIWSQL